MWSNALDCANLDAVKCALKFSWVQMREVESDVTFVRRIAQQRVGPQQRHTYTMYHIHGQHINISTYMIYHTYGTLGGIRHIRGNQPICRTIPVARWSENMWKKEIPICLPPRCERLISKSSHLGRGNRRDIKEIQTEKNMNQSSCWPYQP